MTVDGVGLGAATPLRVIVPPGSYGSLTLPEGRMWKEYALTSLVIELSPDGSFRERKVEASNSAVSRSTFDRPDYAPLFGGDLIREDGTPGTHEVSGTWQLSGDSLTLTLTRDAVLADVSANLEDVMPGVADAIRENVAQALRQDPLPRWTGILRGDRLELEDTEGRVFTFRKPGASGAR